MEIISQQVTPKTFLAHYKNELCFLNLQNSGKVPIIKGWTEHPPQHLNKVLRDSTKYGVRTGEQTNGKILCALDFDIYDKNTQTANPITKGLFNTMYNLVGGYHCFYKSGTEMNRMMLCYINESQSKALRDLEGKNMFSHEGMEVFWHHSKQVVVPPTASMCKMNQTMRKRKFMNPTCRIHDLEEDMFALLINQLKEIRPAPSPPKSSPPKSPSPKSPSPMQKTDVTIGDNQVIDLMNIVNQIYIDSRDDWLKMMASVKNTNPELKEHFYELLVKTYSDFNSSSRDSFNETWENLNLPRITIGTLHYYAEKSNESAYKKIKMDHALKNIDLMSCVTPIRLAKLFMSLAGENYRPIGSKSMIKYDKQTGRWKRMELGQIGKDIDDILPPIFKKELSNMQEKFKAKQSECQDSLSSIGASENMIKDMNKEFNKKYKKIESIMLKVEDLLGDRCATRVKRLIKAIDFDGEFDRNDDVFCFQDTAICLKTGKEILPSRDDYMITACPLNYRQIRHADDKKDVMEFLNSIWDKEQQPFNLAHCATMLSGRKTEHFVFFTGSGGNGKGVLGEMYIKLLGDYAVEVNNSVLTDKQTSGANQHLASCNKKRVIRFKEPPTEKIRNDIIKLLSGETRISARGLYSSNTKVHLCGSLVTECNAIPLLQQKLTDGEARRLLVVNFPNKFKESLKDEVPDFRLRLADPVLKKKMENPKFLLAFFDILLEHLIRLDKNNWRITDLLTNEHRQMSKAYLNDCEFIYNCVNDLMVKDPKALISTRALYTTLMNKVDGSSFQDDMKSITFFNRALKSSLALSKNYVASKRLKVGKHDAEQLEVYKDGISASEFGHDIIETDGNAILKQLGLLDNKTNELKPFLRNALVGWRWKLPDEET